MRRIRLDTPAEPDLIASGTLALRIRRATGGLCLASLVVSCSASAHPDTATSDADPNAQFVQIHFDEDNPVEIGGPTRDSTEITILLRVDNEHRILELHSKALRSGRPLFEGEWHRAHPQTLRIRDWSSCSEMTEATPALTNADAILVDILGPITRPPDADLVNEMGSPVIWRIQRGLMTIEVHESRSDYMSRTVYTSVINPEFYSRARNVRVSHPAVGEWQSADGWELCEPLP